METLPAKRAAGPLSGGLGSATGGLGVDRVSGRL